MLGGYGDNSRFNKFKGFISHNIIEKDKETQKNSYSDLFYAGGKNKEEIVKEFYKGDNRRVVKFN